MESRPARSVAVTGDANWTTALDVGGHALRADEPAALGGADTGPAPDELVLAALAACTSITVRMYAARKQWPLEGIDVTVEYAVRERDRNELARRVVLHGPLDAAQRDRLLQVAEACPVHRLLTGAVSIRTDAG